MSVGSNQKDQFDRDVDLLTTITKGLDDSKLPRGFGFLVPSSEGSEVLGMAWDSRIFPEQVEDEDEGEAKDEGSAKAAAVATVMIGGDPRRIENRQKLDLEGSQGEEVSLRRRPLAQRGGLFLRRMHLPGHLSGRHWRGTTV